MKIQFHISEITNLAERTKVAEILKQTAGQFRMEDMTVTSRVADTIGCYSAGQNVKTWIAIAARVHEGMIIVDLAEGKDGADQFAAVENHLEAALKENFGERANRANLVNYREAKSTLPVSPAALEYARLRFLRRCEEGEAKRG